MFRAYLRLAVDIGGTFTDSVLMGDYGKIRATTKTLTTHHDPSEGAIAAIQRTLDEAGASMDAVATFIHGTTLATNALIEKRGARVATVATEGFRDILEIAYERRYSQYDLNLTKPDFLVPRSRSFTIPERMSAEGKPLLALDEDAVPGLVEQIRGCEAESVAICLLHSYANPAHEFRLRDLLLDHLPDLPISVSFDVSPEAREFDRMCTTVANAYIQPLMARYLAAFETRLRDAGLGCPVFLMTSGGGMCDLDTAVRLPIRLVESGPAGGAEMALEVARSSLIDEAISFDMGGTTAKLCLIRGGKLQHSRTFEVAREARFQKGSGIPLRIPVIDMIEIGAGGGSIACTDRLGRLTVGPDSAGSDPGPVAFGRGGDRPTVTDADIALGYVQPESFADGQVSIDPDVARAAIKTAIADPDGLDVDEAADGICQIVDEGMSSAARMHAAESGTDLESRTLIAFGGNGPLHACRMARLAGVSKILIPADPAVGSAVGFLFARISHEIVRSHYTLLDSIDVDEIDRLLKSMEEQAAEFVKQGTPYESVLKQRNAYMRYRGQGHEVKVYIIGDTFTEEEAGQLRERFEALYAKQYSRPVSGMEIEILNWVVDVFTHPPHVGHATLGLPPFLATATSETRTIRCDVTGEWVEAAVYRRKDLEKGNTMPGPALITEPQTTTFVGRDFTAMVNDHGQLYLTRNDVARKDMVSDSAISIRTALEAYYNAKVEVEAEMAEQVEPEALTGPEAPDGPETPDGPAIIPVDREKD